MVGLEDVIEKLREFDRLRSEDATDLRKGGIDFLIGGKTVDESGVGAQPPLSNSSDPQVNVINEATVLVALQTVRHAIGDEAEAAYKSKKDKLLTQLKDPGQLALLLQPRVEQDQRRAQEVRPDRRAHLPLFVAARVLQALVSTSGEGLSHAALRCYYRILRALYTPSAPGFTIGGISAAERGMPTAFMTGECVRALLGLERTLRQTAEFFQCIGAWSTATRRARDSNLPEPWRAHERQRALNALYAEFAVRKDELAIDPASLEKLLIGDAVADAHIQSEVSRLIGANVGAFKQALEEIHDNREAALSLAKEKKQSDADQELDRSESAHRLATRAIEGGRDGAKEILASINEGKWQAAKERLEQEAKGIRRILSSPQQFLKSVLERELAQTLSDERHGQCDYPEMAFAAAGYGMCRYGESRPDEPDTEWDDPLLARAARLLAARIGTDGLFPVGRPIIATQDGYHLEVIGAEVTAAIACVLRNVGVPFEPEVPRNMLRLFWDTRDAETKAFGSERAVRPIEPFHWTTALCATALDGIVRMLDETIRQEVAKHFRASWPKQPTLDKLFYPDVGLARPAGRPGLCELVQRLRDHLLGVKPQEGDRLWSIVLYGPPGTGKSTIPEALAASAKCQLVEITPSDLVVGGGEQVERRARMVFDALSMLTTTVILFDEFDSVIRRRKPNTKIENIYEFLTPGMLPKLKKLNKDAKSRQTVYVLATNLVGDLDEAAIRDGRFDAKIGLYPPDLLSRTGRLISELAKTEIKLDDAALDRTAKVVHATGGGGMTQLSKEGWLRTPGKNTRPGTPFHFIAQGKESDRPGAVKPEKKRPEGLDPDTVQTADSDREWQEWGLVDAWDGELGPEPTWSDLEGALKKVPALPSLPDRDPHH